MTPTLRSWCLGSFGVALSLLACSSTSNPGGAGGGTGGTVSVSNYDENCSADSDCIAVFSGAVTCCADCPNAAINVSDESKYEQALVAAHPTVCDVACSNIACPEPVAACVGGKCTVKTTPAEDAGPVSCGTMTCSNGEVCVETQVNGGAVFLPNDAGMCPDDRIDQNGQCVSPPSYQCSSLPACATPGGLTCQCAQSLCTVGSCTQASGSFVVCAEDAP